MPPLSINAATRFLGVTGWPVHHSLSPRMHNPALQKAGLNWAYLAFPIQPEHFEPAVQGLRMAGAIGLNVTAPHKQAALELADFPSEEARLIGAANTLHFQEDGIHAFNTDLEGYVESVRQDGGFDWAGKRVAQIGAGGAGRAMALGALQAGCQRFLLLNRSAPKGEALAGMLAEQFPRAEVRFLPLAALEKDGAEVLKGVDILANATSLGRQEGDPLPCPVEWISPETFCYDAVYMADQLSPWLQALRGKGQRILDGTGMLLRQGAASLRIWTGTDPDLQVMAEALKNG